MVAVSLFSPAITFHPFKRSINPFSPKNSNTGLLFLSPFCSTSSEPRKTSSESNKGSSSTDGGERRNSRRPKRKGSYGASRRSLIKKSFAQEQVVFTSSLSKDPVVAIIGGGVSGLVCAATLEERGIRSVVFDTGMHGLGGRMATRVIDRGPDQLVFDHAAQFFTVSDERFQKLVSRWLAKGLIREWKGVLGELDAGSFTPIPASCPRYVAVNGMRSLADSVLDQVQSQMVDVVRPCWISKIEPFNGMWYLSEKDKPHGQFDAIVIAHNGKCATRVLSSSGLPLLAKQMKRLELSAIWALLAAFDEPLPVRPNFEGAFVKGSESLSWMANNTSKLFPLWSGLPQCWTFLSTSAYGKRNKVPQENIPNVTVERVKEEMLEAVEFSIGLPKGSLHRPFYTRVQLWGAALPKNTLGIPCIFDPHGRGGICGDWLLGSNVEAAVLSGMALANHMADYFQSGGIKQDEFAVGLHEELQDLDGHDIGQFPGLALDTQVADAQFVST